MGLTQSAGRIIAHSNGTGSKVNPLDQNDYMWPDIDLCPINEARHSSMGTKETIELNYLKDVINTLSDMEF